MTDGPTALPPRWIIRAAWLGHRILYRLSGGRSVLQRPERGGAFGMLRLTATGRSSGRPRSVILGYIDHGTGYATLAMNGWGPAAPAWWRNLEANPDAVVDTVDGRYPVRARAAIGDERDLLWTEIPNYRGYGDIETFSSRRPVETVVVVLERP